MRVMYQEDDWAITLQESSGVYFIRHLPCRAYLRHSVRLGCMCRSLRDANHLTASAPYVLVDTNILKMFMLLTGVT